LKKILAVNNIKHIIAFAAKPFFKLTGINCNYNEWRRNVKLSIDTKNKDNKLNLPDRPLPLKGDNTIRIYRSLITRDKNHKNKTGGHYFTDLLDAIFGNILR